MCYSLIHIYLCMLFRHYFQLGESIWNSYNYTLYIIYKETRYIYDYGIYRPHIFIVEYKVYSMQYKGFYSTHLVLTPTTTRPEGA